MEHISLKQWFCGSDAMEHIELILNIVCCLNYKRNYDDAKKNFRNENWRHLVFCITLHWLHQQRWRIVLFLTYLLYWFPLPQVSFTSYRFSCLLNIFLNEQYPKFTLPTANFRTVVYFLNIDMHKHFKALVHCKYFISELASMTHPKNSL